MEQWIVYHTTNLLNDKIYIGVHRQDLNPWEFDGYLGSGKYLLNAINLHKKENFTRETLFVYDNHVDAFTKERVLVNNFFVSSNMTYNTIVGGRTPILKGKDNGFYGKHHTNESKKKISLTSKGRKHSIEIKKKISDKSKQYWNDTARINQSMRLKQYWAENDYPEEAKDKLSKAHTGKKLSDDTKRKLSKIHKDLWSNEEYREKQLLIIRSKERNEKISISLKGKKKTPEHINKINRNPEKIRKTAEKHRGMKRSDESRKNMSLAKKGMTAKNKGKIYCHCVTTGKILMVSSMDDIPIGHEKGYGSRNKK